MAFCGTSNAQRLYIGNADVDWSEVTLSGGNLQKKIKKADGTEATQSIPASSVTKLDWPQPPEVAEALEAINQMKYDQALAKTTEVRNIHANWKDKPGSWYAGATLLAIEANIRKGSAAEGEKLYNEIKGMTLSQKDALGLSMMDALSEFSKGIVGPALAKVTSAIKGTDDSSLQARLYLLMGDIQMKRENYLDALEAYLQIPVFLGAQASMLPSAELGAARAMVKLHRFQDASAAFSRVTERFADTPHAALAKQEKEDMEKATMAASEKKEAAEKAAPGTAPAEEPTEKTPPEDSK